MDGLDQKVGYILAKLEEMSEDGKELKGRFDALEQRVETKFRTAETTFRILKYAGLISVAVLTFKFGDVVTLWKSILGN
jgi:hypothetical protein